MMIIIMFPTPTIVIMLVDAMAIRGGGGVVSVGWSLASVGTRKRKTEAQCPTMTTIIAKQKVTALRITNGP